MDERILKWLYDVKLAIEEIDGFFEGQERNLYKYKNSLILKRAVERNLEIIGEAINRIKQRDAAFLGNISEAQSIISLRNQVIHSYDSISDENIWSILTNHLPKLKSEVDNLINPRLRIRLCNETNTYKKFAFANSNKKSWFLMTH